MVHRPANEAELRTIVESAEANGVPVQYMTDAEYMEYASGTDAAKEGYPTLGATDETLLDRTIAATQGVDQGTLAEQARRDGRLPSE
jgi:hypothetical protein